MIKEDFVYIPKVDSGKISIQLSKCEIIHEMLNDMKKKYQENHLH